MQQGTRQTTNQATEKVENQVTSHKRALTTSDIVFKKVFASPQNSHILTGFINDILELNVTEVSIEDTYNIRAFYDEYKKPNIRYTQVDVLARLSDGRQVTIEMQVCAQKLFAERIVYYMSEVYASNYGKHELEDTAGRYSVGERKYSALRPIYGICIMVDNVFLEDKKPIHRFSYRDEEEPIFLKNYQGEKLSTIVFLELKKSSAEMKKNIRAWFDYFKTGEVGIDAPRYLQEACQVAKFQNLEKEEKDMISARQRAEDAALAREDYVWDSGKAEGKAEIIATMISKGKDVKEIVELIDASQEEVEALLTRK